MRPIPPCFVPALPALPAVIALCAFVLAVPRAALAHQNSVTYVRLAVDGPRVDADFRIESLDLNEALGLSPAHDVTRAEALAGRARAMAYVTSRFHVRDAGDPCPAAALTDLRASVHDAPRGGYALELAYPFVCPHAVEDLQVRYDLFFDVDPRHQGLATLDAFGSTAQQVFKSDARDLRASHPRALREQLAEYVTLGIGHIFLGYDHIAFLVGLLLAAAAWGFHRGLRQVLAIVTAFTVAHSLTLVASALGWIAVSPRVVEPAIALSILYVAVENLLPREPRARWTLAFGFGLVHGFGFAGVLSELGLPARGLVPSLLAFNLGVEIGQLAVVAAAFPVLVLLARGGWRPWEIALVALEAVGVYAALTARGLPRDVLVAVLFVAVPVLFVTVRGTGYRRGARLGGSLVLAALAILWFTERVTGHAVLHGALG